MPSQEPLTQTSAWKALTAHFKTRGEAFDLRTLFAANPRRFEHFTRHLVNPDILVDFSKNLVDDETLNLLVQLAREAGVETARDSLFAGMPINTTEGRAVLHPALRAAPGAVFALRDADGTVTETNVGPAVQGELAAMERIASAVRNGTWRGHTGEPITDVVNIGIGGSDLGPAMVCEALEAYMSPSSEGRQLQMHFVSNVDGEHLARTLRPLHPSSTLFVIVSKTFTTAETMANASSAREWLLRAFAGDADAVRSHFVAVSTNAAAVTAFGIDATKMVRFWDWVGGRYSLWSGVGLSIMIAVGPDHFRSLLAGAAAVDDHFRTAPLAENIPVLMALLGVWYGNFWGCETHAVLPYEQALSRLPAYLQQADMESNGKGCDRHGTRIVNYTTGPIVWGEPGTNGQHAFFQLLHQGTRLVPCDFLAGVYPLRAADEFPQAAKHHRMLLANCIAQTEALMLGKSGEQVAAEHAGNYTPPTTITTTALFPQKTFPGNRPSTTFLYDRLSPTMLGGLIALYEHKIFVQGVIWRVNSFDQWGVELGKQLATAVLRELEEGPEGDKIGVRGVHDQSTTALISHVRSKMHVA